MASCDIFFYKFGPFGYFRDGTTKTDLVIVTKHLKEGSKKEPVLTDYLAGIVEYGLSLELECGKLPEHRHLVFIKVHASNEIIRTQGYNLFYSKQFKSRHAELIRPGRKAVLAFTTMQNERVYLGIIRDNYPGPDYYSPLERSQIVYDLLMNACFTKGTINNTPVSFDTLIKMGIVVDFYALHDGPYFMPKNLDLAEVSARQVLFTYWTGLNNIFREQPLHVIHEYLGERVGVFFAFYGAYLCFLITLTMGGIASFVWDDLKRVHSQVTEEICSAEFKPLTWPTITYKLARNFMDVSPVNSDYKDNIWICPNCVHYRICPNRYIRDFCEESKIIDDLETALKLYIFPMFCFICAAIFIKTWKRNENYYSWFWEIDTEFVKNMTASRCCGVHYEIKNHLTNSILRVIWEIVLLAICVLTSFFMLYCLLQYRYHLMLRFEMIQDYGRRRYTVMAVLGVVNMVFVYILEYLWRYVIKKILAKETFQTPDEKENAEARRTFAGTFIFTFTLIGYVAFIKGQYHTTPLDEINLVYLGGILMENCQPLTCMDEVSILIVTMIIMKEFVFKFFPYIRLFGFTTDYSMRTCKNRSPYWEREKNLFTEKETEIFLQQKYREILMQFATTTLFVGMCPLAPFLALVTSAIDLRYCARRILVASRRPLIRRSAGIGPWWYVMVLLVFLIGLSHIMIVTITSDVISRYTEDLDLEMDNTIDHINFKTVFRTFTDYTRINGVSGHATSRTRIGHIPLVLFPEYDYWHHPVLRQEHQKYHVERDTNLRYYRHYWPEVDPTLGCFPRLTMPFYDDGAKSFKPEDLVTGLAFIKGIFGNIFGKTCDNTYIYNPIHHCYFRGFYRRYASVDERAVDAVEEKKLILMADFLVLLGPLSWMGNMFGPLPYTLHHRADLYSVWGYAFGWQHQYEAYLRWWYTTTAVVLMTITLYLIYNCFPNKGYQVTEVFALEMNFLQRQKIPRMKQGLILPGKKTD